jgi:hypothetical protein
MIVRRVVFFCIGFVVAMFLFGCVMHTEDGRRVLTESGQNLLMPFNSRTVQAGIITENVRNLTTETGERLLAERHSPILLTTEAGMTLTTEANTPLEI